MAQNASTLVPKGAFLMGILVEGATPQDTATRAQLDAWIKSTQAPYTYALDAVPPQTDLETYLQQQRDTFLLVDLTTMKIVDIVDSDSHGAIAKLNALLDKH